MAIPVRLLSPRRAGAEPDVELAAYLYLPPLGDSRHPAPFPGLIVGHGASSRAARHEQFCLAACEAGFAVLALDFRGHGQSGGTCDGPLENDLLAAADFLSGHPAVEPGVICYRGSSMGGFYGLKAAPEAGLTALVLICPAGEATMLSAIGEGTDTVATDTEAPVPSSPTATIDGAATPADGHATAFENSARWDLAGARRYFAREHSLALAARTAAPVLLIHARGDEVVPLEHSLGLARHLRGDTTLLVLREGNHTSAQHDPLVHSYSVTWLQERVREARATRERQLAGR